MNPDVTKPIGGKMMTSQPELRDADGSGKLINKEQIDTQDDAWDALPPEIREMAGRVGR